jgi:hypothetical protein
MASWREKHVDAGSSEILRCQYQQTSRHPYDLRWSMATFNLSYDSVDGSAVRISAWERFLLTSGVPENKCASIVAGRSRKGEAIRSWVLANYARRYVPENVLDALGLRKQLVLRWQKEERESAFSITTGEARY